MFIEQLHSLWLLLKDSVIRYELDCFVFIFHSIKKKCWKYRIIHYLLTLLQEMISYFFMIKKVSTNMGPFLRGYKVMGVFLIFANTLLWTMHCKSHYATLNQLKQEQSGKAASRNLRCNLQLVLFTSEQQHVFLPAEIFSKTCLKHRPVSTEGNFMNSS